MSEQVTAQDLTAKEKSALFWASFFSLAAAGFGFAFRVAMGGQYGTELGLTNHEIGQVFGASLWPIAITKTTMPTKRSDECTRVVGLHWPVSSGNLARAE